jgi:hypothetical protein
VQRLVQAVDLADLLERLDVRGVLAADQLGRVAGRQVDDEERDERDADQERDGECQSPERVGEQSSARRVPLQRSRHEPLREVERDAVRAGIDAVDARETTGNASRKYRKMMGSSSARISCRRW